MFRLFHREPSARRAEKLVARGKIEAAIREYRRVLRANPDDTSTLNRVGDLYSRVNKYDEAIHLYRQTAENFVSEGFYVKAIAVYKKIHRLDPSQVDVYEKLADLYRLQGLVKDARTQYEVLVDYYEREGNLDALRSIATKLVELEPHDLSHRLRLADVCERSGDAAGVRREYLEIAKTMLSQGALERATQVLERAVDAGVADADFLVDSVRLLRAEGHGEFGDTLIREAAHHFRESGHEALIGEVRSRLDEEREIASLPDPDVVLPAQETDVAEEGLPGEAVEKAEEAPAETYVVEPAADEPEPVGPEQEVVEPSVVEPVQEDPADLVEEVEVFVRYGFREKALDRLGEILRIAPDDLHAHEILVDLLLEEGAHQAVMEAANRMAGAAARTADGGRWDEVRQRLLDGGFLIKGDEVIAPPATVEEGSEEFELLEEGGGERLGSILEAAKEAASDEETFVLEPPEEEGLVPATSGAEEDLPGSAPALAEEAEVDFVVVDDEFEDLAAEVEREMEQGAAPVTEGAAPSLDEIVESFKKGVAENLSPEDFDTHYNLGIAYREMGLIDEAIGEFEIAAGSPEYVVGCCSLLGLCHREKGESDAAMEWYRRGLDLPQLSQEERLALLYDLAEVHETLGDKASALDIFSEISNVSSDYRDVDARLAALQAQ